MGVGAGVPQESKAVTLCQRFCSALPAPGGGLEGRAGSCRISVVRGVLNPVVSACSGGVKADRPRIRCQSALCPWARLLFPLGFSSPKSEPKELEKVVSWEGAALQRFLAGVHLPWQGGDVGRGSCGGPVTGSVVQGQCAGNKH